MRHVRIRGIRFGLVKIINMDCCLCLFCAVLCLECALLARAKEIASFSDKNDKINNKFLKNYLGRKNNKMLGLKA